jgi:hypothetical protein
MNCKLFLAVSCLSLLVSACESTTAVIKEPYDPYIEVVSADASIDMEQELKESGTEYVCRNIYSSTGMPKNRKACFIKAPKVDKYKDMSIRIFKLPKALVQDAGNNIDVIGDITFEAFKYYIVR